jgi:hypothetical protein
MKGVVYRRHQVAQAKQGDRLQPARPGLIAVLGRPCFSDPDKKLRSMRRSQVRKGGGAEHA